MFGNRRGQNTLEYAVVIAAVVGALLGINTYFQKGLQGRMKESSDQVGRQFVGNKTFLNYLKIEPEMAANLPANELPINLTETRDATTGDIKTEVVGSKVTYNRTEFDKYETPAAFRAVEAGLN